MVEPEFSCRSGWSVCVYCATCSQRDSGTPPITTGHSLGGRASTTRKWDTRRKGLCGNWEECPSGSPEEVSPWHGGEEPGSLLRQVEAEPGSTCQSSPCTFFRNCPGAIQARGSLRKGTVVSIKSLDPLHQCKGHSQGLQNLQARNIIYDSTNLTLFQSKCPCAPGVLQHMGLRKCYFFNANYFLETIAYRVVETMRASLLLPTKSTQIHKYRIGRDFTFFAYFSPLYIFNFLITSFPQF